MIYIDDFRHPAQVGKINARWSHLTSFPLNENELMEFAKRIGLNPEWIQRKSWPHFDVTDTMRKKAIKHGAVKIKFSEYARKIVEWRRQIC